MNSSLTEALAERGYDTLTPVQEAVSDPALASKDLLVSAQTGSGKTVGFGLAIAPTLLGDEAAFGPAGTPLALVVAPTRELAFQVMQELRWLYGKTGARIASCVGGMDMRDERRTLDRGAHIVVGTPGRLRDHITRGSLDMTELRAIVLDEADEMLDLGFREDLEFMLGEAPEDRRTLLFSATVPPTIAKMAQQFQNNAERINTIGGAKQHSDIEYQAVRVAQQDSENAIFNLLRYHDAESALVFANTRAAVNHLMARLTNRGFSVVSLSGELSQGERTNALQAMRDGRARVCVATDVAARGIDLPNLTLVIHADLPTNTESLLHRSGRTGRAGRKGISALIVPPKVVKKAERLLKWAKINAEWTTPPSADDIRKLDEERLINDPVWQEPVTEAEAVFAAQLLEKQSPEVIAAAYLRLYQSRRSAPEELLDADTPPPAREHKAFGPSTWFSLSVGRNDRAEARWLLPLLCRAGNIDKTAIGAIRVQDSETFVEISKGSADGMMKAIGAEGALEDGIKLRQLDSPPNLPKSGPRSDRPERGSREDRGPRKPREDGPRRPREDGPRRPREDGPRGGGKPAYDKAPRKPREKPAPIDPTRDGAVSTKGWKPKGKDGASKGRPASKFGDKPAGKSFGKPAGKGGKPEGKPFGKSGGKPAGKPSGKPAGKPAAAPSGDARDSSKRFVPPGAKPRSGKPAGGPKRRTGGDATPKRQR